jgi:hypothetical protein
MVMANRSKERILGNGDRAWKANRIIEKGDSIDRELEGIKIISRIR